MALIACPQCGSQVSPKATACPRCGEPDPSRAERRKTMFNRVFGFILAAGAASYLWFVALPEFTQGFKQGAMQHAPASQR